MPILSGVVCRSVSPDSWKTLLGSSGAGARADVRAGDPGRGKGTFLLCVYITVTWLGATCSRTVVFFYAALAAIVGIAAVIAEGV